MEFLFLGCGDAFSSGGRLHTCFFVRATETSFLIDCGASSLAAMKRAGVTTEDVDAIFITHFHGDHVGGLPFLLLEAQLVSKRQKPLTLAGPPGLKERAHTVMEALFPGTSAREPEFELRFVELPQGERTHVNSVTVTPYSVQHDPAIPCTGLRFEVDGKVLAYSGDTTWTDTLKALARGADLFVCEAYLYAQKTPVHLDYKTILARRQELGAKRVVLTHLSEEMLGRVGKLELETAEDGMRLEL